MRSLTPLKRWIQKEFGRLGYEIHKTRPPTTPINILPMVIQNRIETRNPSPPFFFIQVGANDGLNYDPIREYVTRYHWRGILVEPQPKLFSELVKNYTSEPQLIFENIALAHSDGEATLYAFKESDSLPRHASMLASFNRELIAGNGFGYRGEIEELRVPALTAASLLSKHRISEIDLLQIDTEGFDYEVIRMFLQTGVKPSIINFESGCLDAETLCECLRLLTKFGYRLLTIGIDTIAFQQKDDESFLTLQKNEGAY